MKVDQKVLVVGKDLFTIGKVKKINNKTKLVTVKIGKSSTLTVPKQICVKL